MIFCGINVIDDFRLQKCKWRSGFMVVAGCILISQEMVIMTRIDFSLERKAAAEVKTLLEVGFEYICQKDNLIFLRKRK
jgi:hypothetical protein